jgi:hypothetical protein
MRLDRVPDFTIVNFMKALSIFFIVIWSSLSIASTRGHFLGLQGMIQLLPTDGFGGSDPDSENLLKAMNVPSQNSMLGPGKSIESPDRNLNLICASNPKGSQCTILLKASAPVKLNPSQKTMQYQVTGADAVRLRELFFLDDRGEFHLISSDGYFRIDVEAQTFTILYNGNGL